MRVLSIGTDRLVFDPTSDVYSRLKDYAKLVDGLTVIVFSTQRNFSPLILPQLNLEIIPTNSFNRWFYWLDALWVARRLFKKDSWRNWDLITAQDPFESGLAAWLISRWHKSKLHLQIHTDFLHPDFAEESWLNKLRVLLAKFLLPRAHGVRVVSQRIADSLVRQKIKLRKPARVLPVFVDLTSLSVGKKVGDLRKHYLKFEKIVLIAARLESEKRLDLALRVFATVNKKFSTLGLIIVGSGSQENNLRGLSRQLEVDQHVVFVGWTSELISYYQIADVFLVTSAYEGYGRTIVEALAVGLPVVSTDVGVAKESGAIVVSDLGLTDALTYCLEHGRGEVGKLRNYPYVNREDYLSQYRRDWESALL